MADVQRFQSGQYYDEQEAHEPDDCESAERIEAKRQTTERDLDYLLNIKSKQNAMKDSSTSHETASLIERSSSRDPHGMSMDEAELAVGTECFRTDLVFLGSLLAELLIRRPKPPKGLTALVTGSPILLSLLALNTEDGTRMSALILLGTICVVPLPLTAFKLFRASMIELCQGRVEVLSTALESDTLNASCRKHIRSWAWSALKFSLGSW